ncbi:MAG: septal ring lytic transglycosylase RlpA family protein [Geminicoccaceae bacterium]
MTGRRTGPFLALALAALLLAACSGPRSTPPDLDPLATTPHGTYKLGQPYRINGIWYFPEFDPAYDETGIASWYGDDFHGLPTANGEVFDMRQPSAAHPTLPLPSVVEVTNLDNGRKARLRVNDRGPFHDNRLIDLSRAAARELGFEGKGLARVRVRFVSLLPAHGVPPVAGTTTRPATVVASAVPAAAPVIRSTPARAPTRSPVRPPARASGCGADDHFVQVAAFSEPANAAALERQLHGLGPVDVQTAPPVSRVRLGPYASRSDAFGMLARVHGMGYRDALVVSCS